MAGQAAAMLEADAAQDQRSAGDQTVCIVPDPDAHDLTKLVRPGEFRAPKIMGSGVFKIPKTKTPDPIILGALKLRNVLHGLSYPNGDSAAKFSKRMNC